MPRYRFQWGNLPPSLLEALAERFRVSSEETVDALRERYGARPREQFVAEVWPLLRDAWLAEDDKAAEQVAATLRGHGLGDPTLNVKVPKQRVAYLDSVRNSKALRSVVLQALHLKGESSPTAEALARSGPAPAAEDDIVRVDDSTHVTSSSPQMLTTLVSGLGVGERVVVSAAGAEGLDLLSFEGRPTGEILAVVHAPVGKPAVGGATSGWVRAEDPEPVVIRTANRSAVAELVDDALAMVSSDGSESLRTRVFDALGRLKPGAQGPLAPIGVTTDGVADLPEITLRERLVRFIAARTDRSPSDVTVDDDGDIPFRSGSSAFFVRAIEDPPSVLLFAPLLYGVGSSAALHRRLNQLSRQTPLRFTEDNGNVFADYLMIGEPFIGQHLDTAMSFMFALLDRFDDELQQEFGGRRFFDEAPKPAPTPRPAVDGGYL